MAASKKKIGMYSIAGVAAAIIIIGAIFVSGINIPNQSQNQAAFGTLTISIKDKPVDLEKLDVTIDGLYIQSAEEGDWLELNLVQDGQEVSEVTFDLLALQTTSELLSESQVATGEYSKIRLDVKSAVATFSDSTIDPLELKVPPGHIDIILKLTVEDGGQTDVLIDMQPDTLAISNSGNFKPVIKATVTYAENTESTTEP